MAPFFKKVRLKNLATFVAAGLAFCLPPLFAENSSADASSQMQAKKIYAVQCALCHGAESQGGEYGPALAGNSDLSGKSAAWLHDVIKNGIPSGGMPAFDLNPADLNALARWIESMNVSATQSSPPGNRGAGKQYFFGAGKCATCHMVAGKGSVSGPDLSNIAGERTVQEIRASLLEPSVSVTPDYESVTVYLRNGHTLHGFARSQSDFEITLQDSDGKFHRLLQNQILSIRKDSQSPMQPVHAGPEEMENLMAYLSGTDWSRAGNNSAPRPPRLPAVFHSPIFFIPHPGIGSPTTAT
jgi:putative heme-binding domain-containing protein